MVPRCFDSRARRTVLAAVFAGLSGCFLDSPFVDIDDGGLTSTDGGAASSGQSEGDASTTGASTAGSAGASQGSQDASSGGSQGDSSSAEGSVGVCGDGAIDGDEVCDDGNDVIADGCEPDCTPSSGQPYWTVVEPGGGFPRLAVLRSRTVPGWFRGRRSPCIALVSIAGKNSMALWLVYPARLCRLLGLDLGLALPISRPAAPRAGGAPSPRPWARSTPLVIPTRLRGCARP